MKEPSKKKHFQKPKKSTLLLICGAILLIGGSAGGFRAAYASYTDNILYQERLSQRQEVTEQLYTGLEEVIDNQWYNAQVYANRMMDKKPSSAEGIVSFLASEAKLSKLENYRSDLVVIDNRGRFYTQDGVKGLLSERDLLANQPSQVSFVSSSATLEKTQRYFLKKLGQPFDFSDGDHTASVLYCGIARDRTELNQYFTCNAYDGKNGVYVLDDQGGKLFNGINGEDYLEGFNVYTQLSNASYLHGTNFEDALKTLKEKGISYSNAVLDGTECYYSLYQRKHASWIILLRVPSSSVAVNTVSLVKNTSRRIRLFAVIRIVICAVGIYLVIHWQQKKALRISEEANAVLEVNNHELEKAQRITKQALKTANSASKAKTEFLANRSHDIRTPRNAIVGLTKLREHDLYEPDKRKIYIHKRERSTQHLLGLINDVLDRSKIESSEVTLNREKVNVAEQVGQVDSILRPQVNERQQHFVITAHEISHEHLIGDAVRLRQIIINLLSNAVKYTPVGGNISLDLAEKKAKDEGREILEITVKDNGCGRSPGFLKHVFEPFTRAENSSTNPIQGTGLGRAITKNIVDLRGGTITVESEVGKGTTFVASLPFDIDTKAKLEIHAKNVLLVSDEANLTKNVKASFKYSGIPLYVTSTKEETEDLLKDKTIDIILLSGYLLSPQLKDIVALLHEKAKNAILVFCVDYTQQDQATDFLKNSGVNGLIARPFFLSNFARTLDQVRNETPERQSSLALLKGRRFLCAEDNNLNAEILKALLDRAGASCTICVNGRDTVKTFEDSKEGDYDAILRDVQRPVRDGLDATRAIRHGRNPLGQKVPIIARTANAFSSDVQECLQAGRDAHLAKPIDIPTLVRTIKGLENYGGGQFFQAKKVKPDK